MLVIEENRGMVGLMAHSIFYPESKTFASLRSESIRPFSLSPFGCSPMGYVGFTGTLQVPSKWEEL